MRRSGVLVAIALALLGGLAGQVRAADATPAATTATERLQALDQAILERTNAVRAAHGLRPLVLSRDLARAALFHSRSMLQEGFFAHESKDGVPFSTRIQRFYAPTGYTVWSAGENLLYNSASLDAQTAVDAWMNSPPHRRNMLDPTWREVGIASLHAPAAGGTFGGEAAWVITADFGVRTRTSRTGTAGIKPRAPGAGQVPANEG